MSSVPQVSEVFVTIPSETRTTDRLPTTINEIVNSDIIGRLIEEVTVGLTLCSRLDGTSPAVSVLGVVAVAVKFEVINSDGSVADTGIYTSSRSLRTYINFQLDSSTLNELGTYLIAKAEGLNASLSSSTISTLYSATGSMSFVEVSKTVTFNMSSTAYSSSFPTGSNFVWLSSQPFSQGVAPSSVKLTIAVMLAVSGSV